MESSEDKKCSLPKSKYVEETEIHGLKEALGATSKVERLCWTFILLTALFFVVKGVVMTALDYARQPTMTHMSMIALTNFPQLMLCHKYWIDEARMQDAGFGGEDLDPIARIFMMPTVYMMEFHNDTLRYASFIDRLGNRKIDQFFEEIAHKPEYLITSRLPEHMHGESELEYVFTGTQPCLKVTPHMRFMPISAAMATFQITVRKTRPAFGVQDRFNTDFLYSGSNAEATWPSDAITLVPGMSVAIKVSAVELKRLNRKDYRCNPDPQVHDTVCVQRYINKVCTDQGQKPFYAPNEGHRIRDITTNMPLPGDLNRCNITESEDETWAREAGENCPKPCNTWVYEAVMTPISLNDSDEGVVSIGLYHPLETMQIEEVFTVTMDTFLSNIGGQLGLWTGASLITLVHALLFCVFRKKRTPGVDCVAPETVNEKMVINSSDLYY